MVADEDWAGVWVGFVPVSFVYRLMYLVGFTPWDTGKVPAELVSLVEGEGALPPGRALDIGCGTGTQAIYLARNGWQVSAVDLVEKPLRRARVRGAAEGVSVDWRRADVTRLADVGLSPGFTLLFDRGCYHGLNAPQRAAYADGVRTLAAPGATLLMMAFAPNRVRVGPAGADQAQIVATFEGWELASADRDAGPRPGGPLREVPLFWYRLVLR